MNIWIIAAAVLAAGALSLGLANWLCHRNSAAWVKRAREAQRK